MTNAIFNYTNNQIKSFKITGHADYAEYGYDIVCSGITTAVFTSLGLIRKYLNENDYDYKELDGTISLNFKETNQLVNDIIENLIEVLKNIERQYPKNLKIKIAKV